MLARRSGRVVARAAVSEYRCSHSALCAAVRVASFLARFFRPRAFFPLGIATQVVPRCGRRRLAVVKGNVSTRKVTTPTVLCLCCSSSFFIFERVHVEVFSNRLEIPDLQFEFKSKISKGSFSWSPYLQSKSQRTAISAQRIRARPLATMGVPRHYTTRFATTMASWT